MSSVLITNISELCTNDNRIDDGLGIVRDAALLVEFGEVKWFGSKHDAPAAQQVVDVSGRAVLPGFVDSHAHLVFAGDRAQEFAARMAGESYSAGGIQTTVLATRAASAESLRLNAEKLASELLHSGVTTFECKTGYGLSVADELKSLEVARTVTDEVTLLAAHVVPPEYAENPDGYVDLVVNQILPAAVGKAKWVDVFCEVGAFTEAQAKRILLAAKALGFGIRMHANQLSESGAARLGVELGCASIDHCTHLSAEDVAAIADSSTVATLLPLTEFSTRSKYPNARALLDAGAQVALATNCNPGSGFSTSMPLAIALAVREMQMTTIEAVRAATMGGAKALLRDNVGNLKIGSQADFIVLSESSHVDLAYRPGVNVISEVWRNGKIAHAGKANK